MAKAKIVCAVCYVFSPTLAWIQKADRLKFYKLLGYVENGYPDSRLFVLVGLARPQEQGKSEFVLLTVRSAYFCCHRDKKPAETISSGKSSPPFWGK